MIPFFSTEPCATDRTFFCLRVTGISLWSILLEMTLVVVFHFTDGKNEEEEDRAGKIGLHFRSGVSII